jgi:hypothetical protein
MKTKEIKLIFLTSILLLFSNISISQSKEVKLAFEVVKTKVLSPGSLKLVESVESDYLKKFLLEKGMDFGHCVSTVIITVDSQNIYGALIRDVYWVFFKNGVPCACENSKSVDVFIGSGETGQRRLEEVIKNSTCGCNK